MNFRVENYSSSKEELIRILLKVFNNIDTEQSLADILCEHMLVQIFRQKRLSNKRALQTNFP